MPVTRAFSALLRTGSYRQSSSTSSANENDDLMALKSQARTASNTTPGPCRPLVAGALAQLNVQTAGKATSSHASSSASTTSNPSRPRYMRSASRFSSRSSTSSRRSILGSSDFGDSSDDENDGQGNSRRLGGCSSFSSAADGPNDNNKENVAPFRCTSQDVLDIEARDAQEEEAIRRTTTRTRQASLVERPPPSSLQPHMRRISRSSTTSDLSATSGKFLILPGVAQLLSRASKGVPMLFKDYCDGRWNC